MLKRALMFSTSAVALTFAVTAAPVHADWINDVMNDDIAKVRALNTGGTDFQANLVREYRNLALFEADEMYDFPSSDYFADKALSVSAGQDEIPAVPQLWDVDDSRMDDLVVGRKILTSTFQQEARTLAPREAAVAQAKYDCWVEQSEEGLALPWQAGHIAECKTAFYAAVENLKLAMEAARPAPPQVSEKPAEQKMSYVPTSDRAIVYFDFDRSAITTSAQDTIDRLVERVGDGRNIVLTVEGHADRSGPVTYNQKLSRERALAVREELVRQGLDVRDVKELKVVAEGESDPVVKTGDGIRHPMNRRAEIAAYRLEPVSAEPQRISQAPR